MAELWLLVGVLVILGLGAWKGLRPVLAHLDARADEIRKTLEHAHALRVEAEEKLAEIAAKSAAAESEAQEIIRQAEVHAEHLRSEAKEKLASDLARSKELAEARLKQAEAELSEELRGRVADLAVAGADKVLREGLGATDQRRLTDAALAEAEEKIRP